MKRLRRGYPLTRVPYRITVLGMLTTGERSSDESPGASAVSTVAFNRLLTRVPEPGETVTFRGRFLRLVAEHPRPRRAKLHVFAAVEVEPEGSEAA